MMEASTYMLPFAAAYYRGLSRRTGAPALSAELTDAPLDALTEAQTREIIAAGLPVRDRLYYFKRTHEDMPRVKKILGFLAGVAPESLTDVGSGRGVFLLPFMERFPEVRVTALDLLPHRVEFLSDLALGGVSRLTAKRLDICSEPLPEKSADVVTMLEVLEHIPDTQRAVRAAVRTARRYVAVTVPSKPDDNPEHIHLFTKASLTEHFMSAGCRSVRFDGVNGHIIMIATV